MSAQGLERGGTAPLFTTNVNQFLDPSKSKQLDNVPEFRSMAWPDYAVPQVAGLALNGNCQYVGSKAFTPDNSVSVPAYRLFNLGARYAPPVAGASATLRFHVDNVFDKFYWRDVTQSLGGYLFPGPPRTFRVSAQFDC